MVGAVGRLGVAAAFLLLRPLVLGVSGRAVLVLLHLQVVEAVAGLGHVLVVVGALGLRSRVIAGLASLG